MVRLFPEFYRGESRVILAIAGIVLDIVASVVASAFLLFFVIVGSMPGTSSALVFLISVPIVVVFVAWKFSVWLGILDEVT